MDAFSYVSYLTSVIIALGLTRLSTGVGRVLQAQGEVKLYWPHLVWTLNGSFFLFMFVLLSPSIAFVLTVLLFPEEMHEAIDLKQHFFKNSRRFFMLGAALTLIDLADTWLKGWDHLVAQGIQCSVTIAVVFTGNLIAAITKRAWFHGFFALFFLVYLLRFITINLSILE